MRRVIICLLFLGLVLGAFADSPKAIQKAIAANYSAIAKAFVNKDWATFESFMADDFQAIPPQGDPADRARVVKEFEGQRGKLSDVKWTKRIRKIVVDGSTAHLDVAGEMKGGMDMGDHKAHTFQLNATSDDDWVRVGKDWKLKRSKMNSFKVLIDGKPAGGQ